ncbi:MAG: tripartite tricarboxylate transporter substrate binding protein [Burkholderiales bacterium]|nr:tripartite tricarboxylate transporter substrate binding protein [Burkholderiales bacterium]
MKRFAVAVLLSLAAQGALAQPFPSRQITMIVGFAAGGGADTAARIIARRLAETIGQPVVIDNRAGAGGNIAADLVAKATPDGHTIGLASPGPLTVAPHMVAKLPYDPLRDFAPLTMAVTFPNVLVVNASVPATTLAEFVRLSNARPGTVTCGSSGIGGIGHLSCELLKMVAKADLVHVPYKGGAPAMTDLLSGQISSIFATPITAGPHIKAGKIRALATTGATRASALPEVPTVAESGYPGFEAINWYCFIAPAKTPKETLERLRRDLVAVLSERDIREQLAAHGMDPAPGTPEELRRYIEREYATWGRVVKAAGITAN